MVCRAVNLLDILKFDFPQMLRFQYFRVGLPLRSEYAPEEHHLYTCLMVLNVDIPLLRTPLRKTHLLMTMPFWSLLTNLYSNTVSST